MIGEHRPAFEYDWRTRFNLPLSEVGRSMPWGEAVRLTQVLQRDPTSHVAAALNDWSAPKSSEWMALADLYDLTQYMNVDPRKRSQVKPYPRPWRDPNSRRRGRTTKSRAEVISILRAHGHTIEGG